MNVPSINFDSALQKIEQLHGCVLAVRQASARKTELAAECSKIGADRDQDPRARLSQRDPHGSHKDLG